MLKGAFISGSGETARMTGMSARAIFIAAARLAQAPVRGWVAVMLLATLTGGPAAAGGKDDHDHDRARAAVRAGEVLPLPVLMERLQRTHPGEVFDVELEREDGRWIYELKLLEVGGRLIRLEVDAGTAEVLEVKPSRQRSDGGAGQR